MTHFKVTKPHVYQSIWRVINRQPTHARKSAARMPLLTGPSDRRVSTNLPSNHITNCKSHYFGHIICIYLYRYTDEIGIEITNSSTVTTVSIASPIYPRTNSHRVTGNAVTTQGKIVFSPTELKNVNPIFLFVASDSTKLSQNLKSSSGLQNSNERSSSQKLTRPKRVIDKLQSFQTLSFTQSQA